MDSFRSLFADALGKAPVAPPPDSAGFCRSISSRLCTLCHASVTAYDLEVPARNRALQEFWRLLQPGPPLQPLIRSPQGRHYRTTTKSKLQMLRGTPVLSLIDSREGGGSRAMDVVRCAIEPESHARVYTHVAGFIAKPPAFLLTDALRYVVIRGNERELTIILTVQEITSQIVHITNTLSKGLTRACPEVRGVLLFEDDTNGRYYLGSRTPSKKRAVRKIFGTTDVYQRFGGRSFLFSSLAFSQVNASLVDTLIGTAGRLLRVEGDSILFDLYCGYGLFTLTLGAHAGTAVGIERSPEAVLAAKANALRNGIGNVRFVRCDITAETLEPLLSRATPGALFLLDPARGGTAPGVIEAVAATRPGRVVHLFCRIDLMPAELERWRSAGYRLAEAVPFDMFPGTDEVEVMALFTPATIPSGNRTSEPTHTPHR